MARTARAQFQQVIRVFGIVERYWHGVRWIRSVLQQRAEGVRDLNLVEEEEAELDPWTALLSQMDADGGEWSCL